jgi:hypothetical protein
VAQTGRTQENRLVGADRFHFRLIFSFPLNDSSIKPVMRVGRFVSAAASVPDWRFASGKGRPERTSRARKSAAMLVKKGQATEKGVLGELSCRP